MKARRNALRSFCAQQTTHAGLWLDKFLEYQTEEKKEGETSGASGQQHRAGPKRATAKQNEEEKKKAECEKQAKAKLFKEVAGLAVPDGYQKRFEYRKSIFSELKAAKQAECCTATVEGRMVIGLGQKGPVEAGLALEHTWGVPIIPGSALKGLTMAAAHLLLEDEEWRKKADGRGPSLALLGGTIEHIGKVIFHDAWWIPEEGTQAKKETLPIHLDVMTVHHPDYYKDGKKSPSDMDSPVPIPFASVTGKFLVVVELSDPNSDEADKLLDAGLFILKQGLAHLGIGAKTNAGYGRMKLDYQSQAERLQEEAMEAALRAERDRIEREAEEKKIALRTAQALRDAHGRVKLLNDGNAPQLVPSILASLLDEGAREEWARVAVQKLDPKKVRKKASEQKAWASDLLQAAKLGG